jgi:hypothetical protein
MQIAEVFYGSHTSCIEVWTEAPQLQERLTAFNVGSETMGSLGDPTGLEDLCAQARALAEDASRPVAVVLTKPPETICIVLPPLGAPGWYMLFDSHPRPGLDSAYALAAPSQEALLERVRTVFPAFVVPKGDEEFWDEGMLFTYNAFEGSVYQTKD